MPTSVCPSHGRPNGRLSRAALGVAPLVWFAGWLVTRLGGHRGPGAAWTVAHLVWVVGFALLAAGSVALYRMVDGRRRQFARLAVPLAVVGAAVLAAQAIVSLVAGWRAGDRADLADLVHRLSEPPGLRYVLHDLGPALLLVGLVILIVLAAGQREGGTGGSLLAAIGVVLMVVGRASTGGWRVFEGLGALFIWLAVLPLLFETRAAEPAEPADRTRTPATSGASGASGSG
ncbi:hypothetical protein [Plantactinospora sp. GCM10030261]|uniref:hypothetical protein n=1 Tax=Plantactinospora sp. GCM10030261 TaxID=3273420 RepID=UPI00362386E6